LVRENDLDHGCISQVAVCSPNGTRPATDARGGVPLVVEKLTDAGSDMDAMRQ
jgi:hypothetical protein